MQIIYFNKITELKKNKQKLEDELEVKIEIQGKKTIIKGSSIDEYEAFIILNAINFGFSAKKSLTLKNENINFRVLNIKDFTRKKNLKEVRARIIGREGKTKRTLENISDSYIMIKENEIGIIGNTYSIEEITTAIKNILRGTKQSNAYRYLEKINTVRKNRGFEKY